MAKVRVMEAWPDESDVELIYSRLSRPVMFCSMTWVTVSCTVWAEAPGYVALTRMAGDATSGYWETGRLTMEMAPASMITRAITQAKMG